MEFSASVGFIHEESVTMHGHTIVKKLDEVFLHYAALACRVKCVCSKSCHVWRRKECLINIDIMRNVQNISDENPIVKKLAG